MAEYPTTQHALLYETEVSQKFNLNKIRKLVIINGQNSKNQSLIIIGA